MQFHPTTLSPTGVLITEGCRGEGALSCSTRTASASSKRYAPNAMELASRDVDLARGADRDRRRPRRRRQRLLDLRHLGAEKIIERLHGTRELAMTFAGVDPIYDPIPVRPGAHYHMGGVDTDVWGLHELEGLYAAGEVRLRLRARREPARRQRADGDDHVRPAGGTSTRPTGRLSHTTVEVPESAETRRGARAGGAARPHGRRASMEDSRRARRRRCTRTSASSGARSRC